MSMRIAAVEFLGVNVTPKTNWCFLQVRTECGRTGTGECTLSDHEALLAAEAARLAPRLVGEDAASRNRLARLLPHAPGGLVTHSLVSALEQALWDLAGQEAGRPIHAMLGGALRENVPLYANINRGAAPRTPEGFAAAAQRAMAAGFRAVKLAPFEPMVWEDAADPALRAAYAEGLARIAAVRDAVGPSVDVMVDAHWRFSPGGAAGLIRDLAPLNLFWLECPVSEANHAEIRRLRGLANAQGMRLAGAETLAGLAAYRPLIESGCYDVLMPDIKYAGGHGEITRIAALAQTAGIEIAPHNPTGPICHGHSVQLCATLPNLLPLEVQFGETERFFTMTEGADQRFLAGTAPLPTTPGLGLALDEADARATPWQPMAQPWLDPRLG
ncbi:mandelate racemase/muconate lactonizing enzyme family protein [Roseococcus sp. SDR]|uniref:mandelate racemase/muconate lactonizing enzyme family protein n=1 Tax=Roseococcus sp. SDR TaxID=2835532 RepID=UPI001BCFD91D|nr:mandelate racemase/muconate lactonizing enzyme family protein [Roseococcus sp. SDR]MBS7790902.1 mandelate racemase/muconate lactonizing enzyme family protein [Roseococcus sp. SDR]MBV1846216.1 mandelate racemase/muconate lactonizing enzyme family protein [Roseococcus sp. SDR]